ncbi:ectonucleotide pyrophosphatase/phosphodiesterase family member 5-like protein [Leptotrombidium deliense]|uniref:Ectonucleotide pyrophosphatase/phosphodiesterase family member 5-like protein n=1 Tax=Leptotrombidium deliense TaxID=299467 RepID=A0A443STZ0_9ACAR|nr:ectonucleotide pyrophosphatase/phosphodiesterase family member 5-like protein [Leptotrombidium deliense]
METKFQKQFIKLATLLYLVQTVTANQVLVISFDGFRYDYYGLVKTPNIDFIAQTGVHAENGIKSVFATKTFPAHWTIATGLYEESHGIIDNKMYDAESNETFNFGGSAKWWQGEPIWVTAKKHGKSVGIYFWPGSEVPRVDGIKPDHFFKYNESVAFEERINVAAHWLIDEKLDLVMLYFNEPDHSGHESGAASEQVKQSIARLDQLLGVLISKLNASNSLDSINILLVSDHGMTNMTRPPINLSDYISIKNLKSIDSSTVMARIEPKEEQLLLVYQQLKNTQKNISVYLKNEIPDRFHYKHNPRIKPILVVADEGHIIHKKPKDVWGVGNHGYDNELLSMRPIFFARGPDFKNSHKANVFDLVDIYPMLCHLLRINAAPNNGSLANVQPFIKSDAFKTSARKFFNP